MQLAQAEGIELLLQLITMLAVYPIDGGASVLWRPHEHLRVTLPRGVLCAAQLRRLVRALPLLGSAAWLLWLDRRLRRESRSRSIFVLMIILVTYLNTYVLRLYKVLILSFLGPSLLVVIAGPVLH